jgi:gliding motility-associated-like protein
MIVSNQWGCKDTIVKPVVVNEGFNIYVPNAFSPNGDGHNDFFQPKGYGIVKYNLVVFDRWGERLFSTDQFENGWDGKYKGQVCKDDTYIWKIVLTGADDKRRELAGTVTIIQ